MALLFALLTLIGWGVGDIFITIASRRSGYVQVTFWGQVFSVLITSLYIPVVGIPDDTPMLFLALILGLLLAGGTMIYFKALQVGNASLAGAIGGSFAVPVVILSMLFFGERLSFVQLVGIFLTIIGVILSSLKLQDLKSNNLRDLFSDVSVKYVLIAVLFWTVFYTFIRIPVERIGWFWSFYPANYFFLILLILGKIKKDSLMIFQDKRTMVNIILAMILILIAQFSYNIGITRGFTSIVAPVAGAYPMLFVLLARVVFKEKLTNQQKLGIISSLAGIVLISISI